MWVGERKNRELTMKVEVMRFSDPFQSNFLLPYKFQVPMENSNANLISQVSHTSLRFTFLFLSHFLDVVKFHMECA